MYVPRSPYILRLTSHQHSTPTFGQPAQFTAIQFEPRPVSKAPAFTPVNGLPSNGYSMNLQHHTSKMPVSRPIERESGLRNSSTQPQRSRTSLPSSNGHENSNNEVTYEVWSPSRLTRSKSATGLGWRMCTLVSFPL